MLLILMISHKILIAQCYFSLIDNMILIAIRLDMGNSSRVLTDGENISLIACETTIIPCEILVITCMILTALYVVLLMQ